VQQPSHHSHDDQSPYRFCPRCGGSLEGRILKATEPERLVCTACEFVFYLDPKIAVGTIIRTDSDRLVLVRRAIEPGYGRWVFPGGYVDRGEPLTTAAIREAKEECGLDVRLEGLVNIYSYPRRAPVIVVYAATAIGGALCCDDEGLEAAEFTGESIPWQELAFRSTEEGLRNGSYSTEKVIAVRSGQERVRGLRRHHLLTWARNQSQALTREAQNRVRTSDKIETANKALDCIDQALTAFPGETELKESRTAIEEFIVSVKVAHWCVSPPVRGIFHSRRLLSHRCRPPLRPLPPLSPFGITMGRR